MATQSPILSTTTPLVPQLTMPCTSPHTLREIQWIVVYSSSLKQEGFGDISLDRFSAVFIGVVIAFATCMLNCRSMESMYAELDLQFVLHHYIVEANEHIVNVYCYEQDHSRSGNLSASQLLQYGVLLVVPDRPYWIASDHRAPCSSGIPVDVLWVSQNMAAVSCTYYVYFLLEISRDECNNDFYLVQLQIVFGCLWRSSSIAVS